MNIDSFVRSELRRARDRVQHVLRASYEPEEARGIIARYTGAFAVNFTDWIGKTIPWTRHEQAEYALKGNQRCEQSEDHVGMLLDFASFCQVTADEPAMRDGLKLVRDKFRVVETAGLFGTALLATLEVTSEDFIPALEDMGKNLGLNAGQLNYTRSHGIADAAHADALTEALIVEAGEYENPEERIKEGIDLAIALLEKIFAL